ncbi:MAG: DNA internalization-related competence protein ComEC/Rec2 [Candidatus Hydrogenedentes bacterium]|nr:DNA internalization-related competence protein ComEC/Rec2 [Candidatus Hydrogenedentota bacterium]
MGIISSVALLLFSLICLLLSKRFTHFQIGIVFLSIGTLTYSLNPYPKDGDDLFRYILTLKPNSYIEVDGVVIDTTLPNAKSAFSFVLDVNKIRNLSGEWLQVNGKMIVYVYQGNKPIFVHHRVQVLGKSSLYLSPTNFYISGYEEYLRAHRIYSQLVTRDSNIEIKGARAFSPFYWLSKLRYSIYKLIVKIAPQDTLGLVKVLWLGDRSDLTREEREYFALSGTAHILAISGLHIGIIFIIVNAISQFIFKDKITLSTMLALLSCTIYSVLSGLHGSSIRALFMISVGSLYILTNRRVDLLSALAIAIIGILTFNPDFLWDIGTQMSFFAVLSILVFYEPFRKLLVKLYLPPALAKHLAVIFASQILLIPHLSILSNRINMLFPLTNLLVVPLTGIFLAGSLVCVPFLFSPLISTPMIYISSFFLYVSQVICKLSASQNWALLNIPSLSKLGFLSFLVSSYLLYKLLENFSSRRLIYFLLSVLILLSVWKGILPDNGLEINLLDVSHGDAIIINSNGNEHILVDSGKRDMGKKVVAPILRARGIKKIDAIIATHSDDDHIGGLTEVIKNFKVGEFIYGENFDTTPNGKELLSLAHSLKIPSRKASDGENIKFKSGAVLNILYSGDSSSEDTNSDSIVAKLSYKRFSILLTGDIPVNKALANLERLEANATILKLPHHGLKNSLSHDFLNLVNPEVVLCSGNEFYNSWGVRSEVKQILIDKKIPLLRTDSLGGILIRTNGDFYTIECARQKKGYKIINIEM